MDIKISIVRKLKLNEYKNNMSFETFKPHNPHLRKVLDYIKNNIFSWYVFYGDVGTGKTHLAVSIAREQYEKHNREVKITKLRHIARDIRSDFDNEMDILNELYSVDLLVIDEVRSTATDFEINILFDIVDERMENNKQTIIITNMDKEEFLEKFDPALMDRLKYKAKFVEFRGESQRKGGE